MSEEMATATSTVLASEERNNSEFGTSGTKNSVKSNIFFDALKPNPRKQHQNKLNGQSVRDFMHWHPVWKARVETVCLGRSKKCLTKRFDNTHQYCSPCSQQYPTEEMWKGMLSSTADMEKFYRDNEREALVSVVGLDGKYERDVNGKVVKVMKHVVPKLTLKMFRAFLCPCMMSLAKQRDTADHINVNFFNWLRSWNTFRKQNTFVQEAFKQCREDGCTFHDEDSLFWRGSQSANKFLNLFITCERMDFTELSIMNAPTQEFREELQIINVEGANQRERVKQDKIEREFYPQQRTKRTKKAQETVYIPDNFIGGIFQFPRRACCFGECSNCTYEKAITKCQTEWETASANDLVINCRMYKPQRRTGKWQLETEEVMLTTQEFLAHGEKVVTAYLRHHWRDTINSQSRSNLYAKLDPLEAGPTPLVVDQSNESGIPITTLSTNIHENEDAAYIGMSTPASTLAPICSGILTTKIAFINIHYITASVINVDDVVIFNHGPMILAMDFAAVFDHHAQDQMNQAVQLHSGQLIVMLTYKERLSVNVVTRNIAFKFWLRLG